MSRMPRAGGRYIIPIQAADGVALDNEAGHGIFTLAANTTYYYVLGGIDAPFISSHLTGYDAALVLTTVTVQDCNHMLVSGDTIAQAGDVIDASNVVGEWIPEAPTTATVGVVGTGWSATNGVVTALGTGVGGAMFHIGETAAARTRLAVVVGAAGGRLRVSSHGKD